MILLRKVKQFWIEGVLDKSLPIKPPLDISKDVLRDAVEHPWEEVIGLPDTASRLIASNKKIGDIFDELGRALLILGEPGSGKTITLLELARDLIARAEHDPSQPFPVVINLSTWIDPRQTLFNWLTQEISDKYKIPAKFTRAWLEENRLLLLLDGLDEVKAVNRGACVEAINAFAREFGLPGVVVSSRLKEYSELPVHLELHAAIHLKPLEDTQINTYLARAGSKLAALQTILQKDPVLRDQAQSPLMLSIMTMAYSMAPQDLLGQSLAGRETENVESRRKHLFETYIEVMFKRKGKARQPYTKEQTLSWLAWLAQKMIQHHQTVFLIEGIQSNWLTSRRQRWGYLLGFSLIFGFLAALLAALGWHAWGKVSPDVAYVLEKKIELWVWVVGCTAWILSIGIIDLFTYDRRVQSAQTQKMNLTRQFIINILIYGFTWFAIWAIIALVSGLWVPVHVQYNDVDKHVPAVILPFIAGLVFAAVSGMIGSKHSFTRDIRTAEAISWSWSGALKGCLWGFAGGLLVWIAWYRFWPEPKFEPEIISNTKIVFLLAYLILGGETGAILIGLDYRILETKTVPNQGIVLSIKNVFKAGFLFWAISGVTLWGIFVLVRPEYTWFGEAYNFQGEPKGEYFSFIWGLIFFSISALFLGGLDVLKHYLLRFILYVTGHIPRKYARFLDYASRLNFLQKVGGGYIFIHRLLLGHFGTMGEIGRDEKVEQP